MTAVRILSTGMFFTLLGIANLSSLEMDVLDRVLAIMICAYGYHLCYAYAFKNSIYVTGATIPYNRQPVFRLFLFVCGFIALYFGFSAIIRGSEFI